MSQMAAVWLRIRGFRCRCRRGPAHVPDRARVRGNNGVAPRSRATARARPSRRYESTLVGVAGAGAGRAGHPDLDFVGDARDHEVPERAHEAQVLHAGAECLHLGVELHVQVVAVGVGSLHGAEDPDGAAAAADGHGEATGPGAGPATARLWATAVRYSSVAWSARLAHRKWRMAMTPPVSRPRRVELPLRTSSSDREEGQEALLVRIIAGWRHHLARVDRAASEPMSAVAQDR